MPDSPRGVVSRAAPLATIATVLVAILVLIDIVSIALLLSGAQTVVRLGFRRLRGQDVIGATQVGAALCAVLIVAGWRWRGVRYIAAGGVIAMTLLAIVLQAAGTSPRFPSGDMAFLESYTLLATQGRLVVGPYSRFGWHHPGPLYFWLMAPLYQLAGHRTLALGLGVLVINLTSIVTMAWIVTRYASRSFALVFLVMTAAYFWRIDRIVLSLWNPHVVVLPALSLAVVTSAMAAGELRLLPVAAVIGSFVAQTHLGLLGYAAGLPAAASVAAIAGWFSDSPRRFDLPTRRLFNLTMWLLVALWCGPIAEQLTHTPGNLTRIWRSFFVDQHRGPSVGQAFVAWADNLAGMWLPGYRINGGGVFIPSAASWPLAWAVLEVLLLGAAMVWFKRSGRRIDAAFSFIALMGSLVAMWSAMHILDDIPEYAIVWISAVGIFGASVIGAAVVQQILDRGAPGREVPVRVIQAIAIALVAGCGVTLWQKLDDSGRGSLTREERQVRELYEGIRAHLSRSGASRPFLRLRGDVWGVAAGVGLQFQRDGLAYAVEDSAIPLFTDAFASNGKEDVELTFATLPEHRQLATRDGNVVVGVSRQVYVDAIALPPRSGP